jgi:hypothetical protein
LRYVLEQVEKKIARLRSTHPETGRLKEAELSAQQRRLETSSTPSARGAGAKLSRKLWPTPNTRSNVSKRRFRALRLARTGLQGPAC